MQLCTTIVWVKIQLDELYPMVCDSKANYIIVTLEVIFKSFHSL